MSLASACLNTWRWPCIAQRFYRTIWGFGPSNSKSIIPTTHRHFLTLSTGLPVERAEGLHQLAASRLPDNPGRRPLGPRT